MLKELLAAKIDRWSIERKTRSAVRAISPTGRLSETLPYWTGSSVTLGYHEFSRALRSAGQWGSATCRCLCSQRRRALWLHGRQRCPFEQQ